MSRKHVNREALAKTIVQTSVLIKILPLLTRLALLAAKIARCDMEGHPPWCTSHFNLDTTHWQRFFVYRDFNSSRRKGCKEEFDRWRYLRLL
jgi:hypothetical protein